MAKKKAEKRIVHVNELDKVMAAHFDLKPVRKEWYEVEVEVKQILPPVDVAQFVADVVSACVLDGANYHPEFKRYAIYRAIIEHYTNITLPQSLDKQFDFLYGTDIIDTVTECVNSTQLHELVESCDDALDFYARSAASSLERRANDALEQLEGLTNNLDAITNGLDEDTVKKLTDMVATGKLGADEIVKAYAEEVRGKEK